MVGTIGKVWALFHRPRARINVEPVLFLFMFATFLSYSTFQQLVHSLVCQQTSNCTLHQNATIIQPPNTTIQPSNTTIQPSNTTIQPSNATSTTCSEPPAVEQEVQNETSHWILFINLASGLPAILMSLFYGSLSDQLGRRIFIILPALGSGINAALVLVVIYLQYTLPITFFLVGAFLSGLLGTFAVINLAVYSYGSDISGHSSRTWQIGLLESMTYLGSTLSLIVGGLWIEKEGFAPPFWCVVACQLAIIIYTVVLLPESLGSRTNNISVQQQERHGKTCPQLCQSVVKNVVSFISLLMGNWTMIALLITFFVVEINFLGITDTVILFALGDPLCWKSDLIGYFLALKVFLNGFATLFILPFLVYYGMSDTAIILVGMVAGAASLLLMGFANHTWIMFIVPAVGAMRGCVVPCIRSMLSKLVPADKQGVLFSSIGMVETSCSLLASVIYNSLYPATRHITPGFSFFVMAATLTIPFTIILVLHLRRCCCLATPRSSETQALLSNSLAFSNTVSP